MSTTLLPAAKDVRDLLSGLVGRTVTVSPGAPVTPAPDRPVAVAVYVAPDMSVNALCLMDLGAAAYTGGAPWHSCPRAAARTRWRRTESSAACRSRRSTRS
jgi:hypothetical protein